MHSFGHFLAWIPDSRHFHPVLGRKFHIESEFDAKNKQIRHRRGQKLGQTTSENISFNSFCSFVCSLFKLVVVRVILHSETDLQNTRGSGSP